MADAEVEVEVEVEVELVEREHAARQARSEFCEGLKLLRLQCGNPPFRLLASDRQGMSASNLNDIINGQSWPKLDVAVELVRALCRHSAEYATNARDAESEKLLVERWRVRWFEVQELCNIASKIHRSEQSAAKRTAAEILADAACRANELLAAAHADARAARDQATTQARDVLNDLLARAENEVARFKIRALQGETAAQALEAAQVAVDETLAAARWEAATIVNAAREQAQLSGVAGLSKQQALAAERVRALPCVVERSLDHGVIARITGPDELAGLQVFVPAMAWQPLGLARQGRGHIVFDADQLQPMLLAREADPSLVTRGVHEKPWLGEQLLSAGHDNADAMHPLSTS